MNETETQAGQIIEIPSAGANLNARLVASQHPEGAVLIADGNNSTSNPKTAYLSKVLAGMGFQALLVDLLTPEEEQIDQVTRHYRFNIELLAGRLDSAVDWMKSNLVGVGKIGLLGSTTGSAASLVTAAQRPDSVGAVVSNGGRPDMASLVLKQVQAPTLLIAGELDSQAREMAREVMPKLPAVAKIEVIPGVGPAFEKPGALDEAARAAGEWFRQYAS